MACLFSNFTGQTLSAFDRAVSLTGHWNDLYLGFGKKKLVFYEPMTIPFTKRKDGSLKRFPNWNRPPEEWKDAFVDRQLVKMDLQCYEKNIYLEFKEDLVLLSNKELMALFYEQKCLWATMEISRELGGYETRK
jgi:hypothetical protein